jgi:hypothetical protein
MLFIFFVFISFAVAAIFGVELVIGVARTSGGGAWLLRFFTFCDAVLGELGVILRLFRVVVFKKFFSLVDKISRILVLVLISCWIFVLSNLST